MNHTDIVAKLEKYAKSNSKVSALFALGSFARGDMEPYSDIDMVIISSLDPGDILKNVRSALSPFVRYEISESENKKIMFLSEKFLRLDLIIVKDPRDVKELVKESRITHLSKAILVDKSNSLLKTFKKWNSERRNNLSQVINNETAKFLASYESASAAARKEDVFQSYFQYNLSLTRLVRLIQLEEGDDSFLYAPKRFMNKLPPYRKNRIERLSGSLKLNDARSRIDYLAIEFRETYSTLYSRYRGLERTPKEIEDFLKNLQVALWS